MWAGAPGLLDRKLLANYEAHKNRESCQSHVQTLLVCIPGHQVQLRHCSPVGSSPILHPQVQENANSLEPDQRMQVYDCHSSESILPVDHRPRQVLPLDKTFIIPFKMFLYSKTFLV